MQQFDNGPLKINNSECISHESFPRERCGGYCESYGNGQCKCYSVGTTYTQSVLFNWFVNRSQNVTEARIVDIRRI